MQPDHLTDDLARHAPFLRRLARGLVADASGAEDLVQETLLAAIENPPRSAGTLRPWLARVLRNKAHNRRRDGGRRAAFEARAERPQRFGDPAWSAERLDTARTVLDAIEALSPDKRAAVLLRYYEGLPPRAIALRLGIPVDTVKTRLKRALAELRAHLAESHGGDRWRAVIVTTFGLNEASDPVGDGAAAVRTRSLLGALLMTSTEKTGLVVVAALLCLAWALWNSDLWPAPRGAASGPSMGSAPLVSPDRARSSRPRRPRRTANRESNASLRISQPPASNPEAQPSSGPAEITGLVLDARTNAPVAAAEVFLAVLDEASTGRAARESRDQDTLTDSAGHFRFVVAAEDVGPQARVEVVSPGFGSASGPLNRHAHPQTRAEIRGGGTAVLTIRLEPSLYVEGVVEDEDGALLADVDVLATADHDDGYGYIARARTDRDGRFRVYDFEVPETVGPRRTRAALTFTHEDFLKTKVADCYALDGSAQRSLRIVMRRGFTVDGFVFRADGDPAAGLLVEAFDGERRRLRATACGRDGGFELTGLRPGSVRVAVRDASRLQSATREFDLREDARRLELRMTSFVEAAPRRHALLGLDLADATPALRAGLGLHAGERVCILGTQPEHRALGIGELLPGDTLLKVGFERVTSVRGAVEALVAAAKTGRPTEDRYTIRVVYGFRRVGAAGSNTQPLSLSADQLQRLEEWLRKPAE